MPTPLAPQFIGSTRPVRDGWEATLQTSALSVMVVRPTRSGAVRSAVRMLAELSR